MNAVTHLASLLAPAVRIGSLPMQTVGDIDAVIEALQGQIKGGSPGPLSVDLQQDALRRFWATQRLDTLKDARLVAFGLCLPSGPEGHCVLDNGPRFNALLQGIDQWLHDPRWYRRCYQGLMWSYFRCEIDAQGVSPDRRENWLRLRKYLAERAPRTVDHTANPDWVRTVVCHRHLFGDSPCDRHAAQLLRGDRAVVDLMCEQLGIQGSSWFFRTLIKAQVTAALQLVDDAFCAVLPSLIDLLSGARALRDDGLAHLLARYDRVPQALLHEGLRDAAAQWWGAPWRPSSALHWSGLPERVRRRVSAWIKSDLIERFFTDCGDAPDGRRAAYWKRYVHSIQKIELACADTALVMTMGRAVVVEFSDPAVAMHAYDLRQPAPFDMSRPLVLAIDADNLLRQGARCVCLPHQDGQHGWRQWEQMFEAALIDQFGIRPGTAVSVDPTSYVDLSNVATGSDLAVEASRCSAELPRWQTASAREDVFWHTAEAACVPYSRADLEVLARVHALTLDDQTVLTGKLWVRADEVDPRIAEVLIGWGFAHVQGVGWHR